MTVRITGLTEHIRHTKELRDKMRENVTLALIEYAGMIANIERESIKLHGIPSPNHIVSTPGEPPNADTHDLDRSIHTRFQGEDADASITGIGAEEPGLNTRVVVETVAGGPTAPYAPALETGTSNMAARPFALPASQQAREPGRRLIDDAVRKTLKGG